MLPQDPRENQEVVTSLRGELLSFFLAARQLIRSMYKRQNVRRPTCMCKCDYYALGCSFTCVFAFEMLHEGKVGRVQC